MYSLSLAAVREVLCIGAHADDIEIGCGGTILSLITSVPNLVVSWVVLSAGGVRESEARETAAVFLDGAGDQRVEVNDFRDGFFPYDPGVKEYFELLKGRYQPDLILTHRRGDLHQDHRSVCELTWNTFRNHLILEYEIPKWDGDLGCPNVYIPLNGEECEAKLRFLMNGFGSQQSHHWYDPELFRALMRIRGMECAAPSRYAEGFYVSKAIVSA